MQTTTYVFHRREGDFFMLELPEIGDARRIAAREGNIKRVELSTGQVIWSAADQLLYPIKPRYMVTSSTSCSGIWSIKKTRPSAPEPVVDVRVFFISRDKEELLQVGVFCEN